MAVERVVRTGLGIKIVQLVTDDPDAARCPSCRVLSSSGKDWVLTRPRDLPCGGELMSVQWRKRRWRCRAEHCPRQTFTEQVVQVPAGMRTTTRPRTAGDAVEVPEPAAGDPLAAVAGDLDAAVVAELQRWTSIGATLPGRVSVKFDLSGG